MTAMKKTAAPSRPAALSPTQRTTRSAKTKASSAIKDLLVPDKESIRPIDKNDASPARRKAPSSTTRTTKRASTLKSAADEEKPAVVSNQIPIPAIDQLVETFSLALEKAIKDVIEHLRNDGIDPAGNTTKREESKTIVQIVDDLMTKEHGSPNKWIRAHFRKSAVSFKKAKVTKIKPIVCSARARIRFEYHIDKLGAHPTALDTETYQPSMLLWHGSPAYEAICENGFDVAKCQTGIFFSQGHEYSHSFAHKHQSYGVTPGPPKETNLILSLVVVNARVPKRSQTHVTANHAALPLYLVTYKR